MSTQDTSAADAAEPATIAELHEDIEQTRERLGETVDELSHRLDVKGRAQDKVADVKTAAQDKATDVKDAMHDRTAVIGSQVSDMGSRVKPLVQRREVQAAAGGAVLLGVGAMIARRRGK